jgi:sialidase-1
MRSILCCLYFLMSAGSVAAQRTTPVFIAGKEGYHTYRIPAMVQWDHKLFAFAEGRLTGSGDFGDVDIVMKTSTNNGKTWSALQVVASNGQLQASNPAPVLDQSDPAYPKGRLFLFYNTGNASESANRKGKGIREVWYICSENGGISWDEPVNITTEVHRPHQPGYNTAYHFQEDWRSYANTPGHAIQISKGTYAGRIYVAANHSAGEPEPHFTDYRAHAFYSDDHGKTFHISQNIPFPGSNESMAAELSHNRLIMNSRNQTGMNRQRIVSYSINGGETWDTSFLNAQLTDPVCQGSLLNLGIRNGKTMLAFCNPADSLYRNHLTLRISYDEGHTWPIAKPIETVANANGKDAAAYSDMVTLGHHRIGILYERNQYTQIVFTSRRWN